MLKFPLVKLVESIAILNVLVLCIGSYYQFSFYSELDLRWPMSLLSISSVLFNSIPLFSSIFAGCLGAYFLNHFQESLFPSRYNSLKLLGSLILFFFLGGILTTVFTDRKFVDSLIEVIPFMISFISLSCYYRLFSKFEPYKKFYLGCILTFLIYAIPIIHFMGTFKAEKLLEGHHSFSKVSLPSNSSIPTSYFTTVGKKKIKQEIDWRVVEVINEKVIIIGLNSAAMNGGTKNQVRIIDQKDIEAFY